MLQQIDNNMVMINTMASDGVSSKKLVYKKLTVEDTDACLALQSKVLKEEVPMEWVKNDAESQRRYEEEKDGTTIKGQKYIIERSGDDYKNLITTGYGGVGAFDGDKLVGTAFMGPYKEYTENNLLGSSELGHNKIREEIESGLYKAENMKEVYGVMVDREYQSTIVEREDGKKTKLSTALIAETLKSAIQQINSKEEHLFIIENALSNVAAAKFTEKDLNFEEKVVFKGRKNTILKTSGALLSTLKGLNNGQQHEYTLKGKRQGGQKVSTLQELAGVTSGGTSAQSVQGTKVTSKDKGLSM